MKRVSSCIAKFISFCLGVGISLVIIRSPWDSEVARAEDLEVDLFTRDEFRGMVVDFKPPIKVEGSKKVEEVEFTIKLDSKEFCLGQIYFQDREKNAIVPYKITKPEKLSFSIGIGMGTDKERISRPNERKEMYGCPKEKTYISKGQRREGIGKVGAGLGIALPVFDLFKVKGCQRELNAHFVLPKDRERIEDWNLALSIINPETKEEMLILYNLSETQGKIRTLE